MTTTQTTWGCSHSPSGYCNVVECAFGKTCQLYIRTNDVMSNAELRLFLDFEPDNALPKTIPVCSGEWRREPDGASYRAWDHPKD